MIFASDLDQTLIYSNRSIGTVNDHTEILDAEILNGDVISYMTKQVFANLKKFTEMFQFIPVTTRTIEQYKRIHLIVDQLMPKYAITSNGGNILINGVQDMSWNTHVRNEISRHSESHAYVMERFNRIRNDQWVHKVNFCDELFYAVVIEREFLPTKEMHEFSMELTQLGWQVSLQGRKLYFVPNSISKSAALAHLHKQLPTDIVVAAGDSLLDKSLLDYASHAIAPRHGELYKEEEKENGFVTFPFTQSSGIAASNEILDYVLFIKNSLQLS